MIGRCGGRFGIVIIIEVHGIVNHVRGGFVDATARRGEMRALQCRVAIVTDDRVVFDVVVVTTSAVVDHYRVGFGGDGDG